MSSRVGLMYTDEELGFEERRICDAITRRGHECVPFRPQEVLVRFSANDLHLESRGENLVSLACVIIRRTRFAVEASADLAFAFSKAGVATVDGPHGFFNPLSKVIGMFKQAAEAPMPQTVVISPGANVASLAWDSFPAIVKPVSGRMGQGVALVHGLEDLRAHVAQHFAESADKLLLQERLDITHEYRCFVVGDTVLGICRKDAPRDAVTRNVATGAKMVAVDKPDLHPLAVKVARRSLYDVVGVDICETPTGVYLLEANRNPQFKGFQEAFEDVDVAGAIVDFALKKKPERF